MKIRKKLFFALFLKQVNSISIQPTVENPLNRIPIRGDIYTKAAQLRILSVPGSKIEDRQYELMFENISLGSGKWEEIARFMDPYVSIKGKKFHVPKFRLPKIHFFF